MRFTFTTKVSQKNPRKLATDGVFTVDGRFSDRLPLKVSRQYELVWCWFYHQSEPLNTIKQE